MTVERLGLKWVKVDLNAWESNLTWIKKRVAPAELMPVIKANAYGHGSLKMAQACEKLGLKWLVVATLREAIELRRGFVNSRILVLGATPESQISDLINYRVTATVCDVEYAIALNEQAKRVGQKIKVHVYIDTGMGRMGQAPEELAELVKALSKCDSLEMEGLYSHFAVSDELDSDSEEFTRQQWQRLSECFDNLEVKPPLLHISNSGGVMNYSHPWGNAVRPGLICYGIAPGELREKDSSLKKVMSLHCRPLYIKKMKKGESVGYGRLFKLEKDTTILTLPVGYADGVPRRIARELYVSIKGKPYPVVGKICMDMMMVDLGQDEIDLKADVTLLGEDGPTIEQWSEWSDTIPYEIMTSIGRRWSYLYTRGSKVDEIVLSEA